MIGLFIALIIALGAGGTAVVADNARPGDALFGIDRAVENMRISFAGDEKKNELRIRFAEERIGEIDDLVDDDGSSDDSGDDSKKVLTAEEQASVNVGIEAALNLLTNLQEQQGENPRLDDIISRLNAYLDDLPSDAKIEIGDDKLEIKFKDDDSDKDDNESNKSKIEIRTDEGRIKIEVKDGVLEIKTKLDDDNDDDDDASDQPRSVTGGLEEAEAKVFSDKTIIQLEINDEKTTFTTTANTREGIVAAIVEKFPTLTSAQVNAVLEIETEGTDETDDQDDDSDDDSDDNQDDDSDDSDEDDDSDDDSDDDNGGGDDDNGGSNSGSGSN